MTVAPGGRLEPVRRFERLRGARPVRRAVSEHVRAAHWIEALGEGRSEDHAEMLAHHYLSALELTRAAGGDSASSRRLRGWRCAKPVSGPMR